ncbi:MAG: lipoyl(octanoyl) transferase LipB [Bacteroidota bacterium]|nr:lipoyl(octanoyl) transferase LipB [Bacteroidota bacterium]
MTEIYYRDLGRISYKKAFKIQEELFNNTVETKIKNRKIQEIEQLVTKNHLLFCVHNHVITLGKSGDIKNLLFTEQQLKNKNIEFYKTNRGGDITYHGPGQIVAYPIFDLNNFKITLKKYIYLLEEVIIRTLNDYKLEANRANGMTGVWLDADNKLTARKICAIGVKASRWVSMHGFAFNINTDLGFFDTIVPCGIKSREVTSLKKELEKEINLEEVKEKLKKYFSVVFNAELVI